MSEQKKDHRLPGLLRIPAAIALTLLGGALGNGVWEWFLRDLLNWLGSGALRLFASVWTGFIDQLYRRVGSDLGHDQFPSLILLLGATLGGIHLMYSGMGHMTRARAVAAAVKRDVMGTPSRTEYEPAFSDETVRLARAYRQILKGGVLFIAAGLLLGGVLTGIQVAYGRKAALWAEQSIEIVAPNISEQERLQLRAALRSVETGDQFFRLYDRIRQHKPSEGLRLRPFDPVGYRAVGKPAT